MRIIYHPRNPLPHDVSLSREKAPPPYEALPGNTLQNGNSVPKERYDEDQPPAYTDIDDLLEPISDLLEELPNGQSSGLGEHPSNANDAQHPESNAIASRDKQAMKASDTPLPIFPTPSLNAGSKNDTMVDYSVNKQPNAAITDTTANNEANNTRLQITASYVTAEKASNKRSSIAAVGRTNSRSDTSWWSFFSG